MSEAQAEKFYEIDCGVDLRTTERVGKRHHSSKRDVFAAMPAAPAVVLEANHS